jgi:hypothetical protein
MPSDMAPVRYVAILELYARLTVFAETLSASATFADGTQQEKRGAL